MGSYKALLDDNLLNVLVNFQNECEHSEAEALCSDLIPLLQSLRSRVPVGAFGGPNAPEAQERVIEDVLMADGEDEGVVSSPQTTADE